MAGRSDMEKRRQQRALHLYNDTTHWPPLVHAHARSCIPARHRLAEHRLQPAAAHGLLSWNGNEKTAEARPVHSGQQSGGAAIGGYKSKAEQYGKMT
ncbi:hypothetical protein STFR1_60153 [Bacillus vallismortis]